MIPELLEKMGQIGNIEFPDEVLKYLINSYTLESGVRKLKELLYEIVGEINQGLLVLLGVEKQDDETTVDKMADRLLAYRVFSDADGKIKEGFGNFSAPNFEDLLKNN